MRGMGQYLMEKRRKNEAKFKLTMRRHEFEFGMYNYLKEFKELILSGKFEEFTKNRNELKTQEAKPTE